MPRLILFLLIMVCNLLARFLLSGVSIPYIFIKRVDLLCLLLSVVEATVTIYVLRWLNGMCLAALGSLSCFRSLMRLTGPRVVFDLAFRKLPPILLESLVRY